MAVGTRINPLMNEGYSDAYVTDESVSDGYRGSGRVVKIDPASTPPLPTDAARYSEQQTQTASLSVLDDWDESDRAKVNPIVGQAGVQGGSGVVTALTQRVVLATDVALPPGNNNIGDVDIVSTPKASSANTPSILTSGGDVISANSSRKSWSVQNCGTNPLFVRMATGASSTVFHFVLKGGTANDDGLGGFISDDTYTGIVSATGTSPRMVVSEL